MTTTTRHQRPPRTALLVLLTAVSVLPVNVHLPALPSIADDLDASDTLINLSVAGYAIATAATEVVAGSLSDRFGRRPVALVAVSVFVLASLGCAAAQSITVFLVCRALQATVAACFSIAVVAINDTSSQDDTVRRIGLAGMGWALAPMLAPTLGGALDEVAGWRSIFVVLAALGAVVLVLVWRHLAETSAPSSRRGLLASARPLLTSPRFLAYTACAACSTGTLYVFLGGAPLVLGDDVGGSSLVLGLYLALVPGGFVLGSYLTGLLAPRWHPARILVGARALTVVALSVGLLASLVVDLPAPLVLVLCVSIGVGNGLTGPVVSTAVMSERADLAGTAAGLSAALAIGGGALVSALAGAALGAGSSLQTLLALLLGAASSALICAVTAATVDRAPAGGPRDAPAPR